jgi:hypothetical protein
MYFILPHQCHKSYPSFSARPLSPPTMRPRHKAPSKSTAAASPATSPGTARRSTRLASCLYGTEQLPNVGSLESATSCQGDATSNEASSHDISVQAPSLASISENAPIGNAHELTSLFTVPALLATTKDNFHIPNFGSDDNDKGDHIDASICKPEDDRKPAAKTDDDDVNANNDYYDAIFDSREEKKDDNPDNDDYVEDENNDEDEEEEEEVEVVGTTMSINPVDKLLFPDIAAFFANNENNS